MSPKLERVAGFYSRGRKQAVKSVWRFRGFTSVISGPFSSRTGEWVEGGRRAVNPVLNESHSELIPRYQWHQPKTLPFLSGTFGRPKTAGIMPN